MNILYHNLVTVQEYHVSCIVLFKSSNRFTVLYVHGTETQVTKSL